MRRVYWLWAAGLLLKGIGATWDVAWHFRTLREALTPPHLVNIAGAVLCTAALWHEWRARDERRTGPLMVVLTGVAMFLLAIPFDQWWHMTFGIDLTTWSPAHLLLFAGTAVSVLGVLMLYVVDLAPDGDVRRALSRAGAKERAFLAFFVIFVAAAFYFPLTYNEYTTVVAQTIHTAPETIDPALVELALSLEDPVFHNTPRWLYPVYSVGIAVFVGTLARAWLGRGWALVALGGVAAERAAADAVLTSLGWPGAALPLQFAAIGVAIELLWLPRAPLRASAVAGGIAGAAAGYAYFVWPMTWKPPVPLTADSWPAGVAVAVALSLAGLLLAQRGIARVGRVPPFEIADVRAWVARKWSATRR